MNSSEIVKFGYSWNVGGWLRNEANFFRDRFGHLMWRVDSMGKTPMLQKIEGKRRRGQQRMRCWMASRTRWTWVWVNSGSWWWTGRPGVLQSMGSWTVGHGWVNNSNNHLATDPQAGDGVVWTRLTGAVRKGGGQGSDNSSIKRTLTPPSSFNSVCGNQMLKQPRQSVCSL